MLCGIWNKNGSWCVRFISSLSQFEIDGLLGQPKSEWWDAAEPMIITAKERKEVVLHLDRTGQRVPFVDAKAILVTEDARRTEEKRAAILTREDEVMKQDALAARRRQTAKTKEG